MFSFLLLKFFILSLDKVLFALHHFLAKVFFLSSSSKIFIVFLASKSSKSGFEKFQDFFNFKFSHTHTATHSLIFCVFGVNCLVWGGVMFLVLGFFLNNNCFQKIRVVRKRIFKYFTTVILKRTNYRQVQWFYCCCCFGSADC